MQKIDYALIVACIRHGAPAIANELIGALNADIKLVEMGDPNAQHNEPKQEENKGETK